MLKSRNIVLTEAAYKRLLRAGLSSELEHWMVGGEGGRGGGSEGVRFLAGG